MSLLPDNRGYRRPRESSRTSPRFLETPIASATQPRPLPFGLPASGHTLRKPTNQHQCRERARECTSRPAESEKEKDQDGQVPGADGINKHRVSFLETQHKHFLPTKKEGFVWSLSFMRCKDLLLLVAFVVLAFLANNLHGVIRQRGRKICHKKKGKETEGKGR